jgi:CheY-like chemotaxis protein
MADQQDRTEAPTAKRLQKARAEGQAPLSREATALAVLSAAALVLTMGAPGIAQGMVQRLSVFLAHADRLDPAVALRMAALAVLIGAAPMVMAALVAGAVAVLLQTGFLVKLHSAAPDPGEAALALLDAGTSDALAAIVTDMVMPGMDGIALVRAVRERLGNPGLPAILVSGYAEAALRRDLESVATTFMAKPYTLKEMVAKLEAEVAQAAGTNPSPFPRP